MKSFRVYAAVLLLRILFTSGSVVDQKSNDFIISHVTIITMEDTTILRDYAILVSGEKIKDLFSSAKIKNYPGIREIDGRNGYIIPGLHDSHCHVNSYTKSFLNDFLDFGVTSIRVCAGNEAVKAWRDSIRNNLMEGPDIFLASPLIDGNPPVWGSLHDGPVVTDVDSVEGIVKKLIEYRGYDMLKLYSRLKPDVYLKFLEIAKTKNIMVTSHIPIAFPIDSMFSPLTQGIEHLSGYGRYVTSNPLYSQKILSRNYDTPLDSTGFENVDGKKLSVAVKKTVQYGIWNCPTMVLFENTMDTSLRNLIVNSEYWKKYPELIHWWKTKKPYCSEKEDIGRRVVLNALNEAGAKLLAGTDCPNPWVLPGLSLHQELFSMCKAGLTPYQALKTATINASVYLNESDKKGIIKKGYSADFLWLNKNPLVDIRNTLSLNSVVRRGVLIQTSKVQYFYKYYMP